MNIRVHIERLVLDGLPLTPGHGPLVQAAVEVELARLLTEGGLSAEVRGGGTLTDRTGEIILPGANESKSLGEQVAKAVYGGIGQ